MLPETMTVRERLEAAVSLRPCDRVPVGFPLSWFTARHAGITMARFAADCEANAAAVYRTFQDLGGIDLVSYNFSPLAMSTMMPIKQRVPGRDLPEDSIIQYNEQQIMPPEEYDIVISKGWSYYNKEYIIPRTHPEYCGPEGEAEYKKREQEVRQVMEKARPLYAGRAINFTDSFMAMPPFETLSMARSFGPFLLDLYRRPDRVLAAMETMIAEDLETIKAQMKSGKKIFGNTAISRSANTFISAAMFEKYVFPYVRRLADLYMSYGLIMLFHLDQDWLKFLPFFRQLPEGRYVLQLDGATDIFAAKKVIGDRMCIMGDVPARLLKLGTPDAVRQYCQNLITRVGQGSGFILSCGCDIPVDARFENVQAMVVTAKEYPPPR